MKVVVARYEIDDDIWDFAQANIGDEGVVSTIEVLVSIGHADMVSAELVEEDIICDECGKPASEHCLCDVRPDDEGDR